jgi:hypothetical protein
MTTTVLVASDKLSISLDLVTGDAYTRFIARTVGVDAINSRGLPAECSRP